MKEAVKEFGEQYRANQQAKKLVKEVASGDSEWRARQTIPSPKPLPRPSSLEALTELPKESSIMSLFPQSSMMSSFRRDSIVRRESSLIPREDSNFKPWNPAGGSFVKPRATQQPENSTQFTIQSNSRLLVPKASASASIRANSAGKSRETSSLSPSPSLPGPKLNKSNSSFLQSISNRAEGDSGKRLEPSLSRLILRGAQTHSPASSPMCDAPEAESTSDPAHQLLGLEESASPLRILPPPFSNTGNRPSSSSMLMRPKPLPHLRHGDRPSVPMHRVSVSLMTLGFEAEGSGASSRKDRGSMDGRRDMNLKSPVSGQGKRRANSSTGEGLPRR